MASTPEASFSHSSTYRAYLIRLWRERDATVWRASAQDARTGEIVRFESLRALCTFIETVTRQSDAGDPSSDGSIMG
jgi:hypothetical protein